MQVACPYCPYTSSSLNVWRHKMKHHAAMAPHRCAEPGCAFSAFDEAELAAHSVLHLAAGPPAEPPPVACPHCAFRTTSQAALAKHVARRHAAGPASHVTCPQCPAVLCDRHSLYKHCLTCHGASPRWVCACAEGCTAAFRGSLALRKHAMEAHGVPDPFRCVECAASFTRLTAFEMHRRECHGTGRAVFRCARCPQTFTTAWHERRHRCPNEPAAATL
jgi:hypothetical protein